MSQHPETPEQAQPAPEACGAQDAATPGELSDTELDAVSGGAASLALLNELLSNVSKTRSEISMTFARNARA